MLIVGVAWQFLLKDYQKQRITSFLFPYDYLGASWSQNQTKISIGSGQILGEGLSKGSQVQYGFLPEPHTDFIFSVESIEVMESELKRGGPEYTIIESHELAD